MFDRRIFYITTPSAELAGDYNENMALIGLRQALGEKVIDWPKKKVLYGEFDKSPRQKLHGKGFTLYNIGIQELVNRPDINDINENDIILFGISNQYGVRNDIEPYKSLIKKTKNVFYIDGGDNITYDNGSSYFPCFKREMTEPKLNCYPFGFSIPHTEIRDIPFVVKNQLYAKSAPPYCFDDNPGLRRSGLNYIFNNEQDYDDDIARSWFGLSCLKGGWSSLRTLEIIANGAVVIFKDYDKKPAWCDPRDMPCFSYRTVDELNELMNRLVINNYPTDEYIEMRIKQLNWLYNKMTCFKRGEYLINTINNYIDKLPYKQGIDFKFVCISNRPSFYEETKKYLKKYSPVYFNGDGYQSFSKLVNCATQDCPTDIIIICGDKVSPRDEDIEKILHLLSLGYGFVGLYSFALFGFHRSLFNKIGPMDERYIGGYNSDIDFYLRMDKANIAFYKTHEVEYRYAQSSWNNSLAGRFHNMKWTNYNGIWTKNISEEKYDYKWPQENIKYLDNKYTIVK